MRLRVRTDALNDFEQNPCLAILRLISSYRISNTHFNLKRGRNGKWNAVCRLPRLMHPIDFFFMFDRENKALKACALKGIARYACFLRSIANEPY